MSSDNQQAVQEFYDTLGITITGPTRYGDFYWCIKTSLSPDGEMYIHADSIEVAGNGALLCMNHSNRQKQTTKEYVGLAIAPGEWSAFFAASVLDGSAVTVDRWEGEVIR